jgi:DNA-binding XRE family transcriptional regulator
MSKKELLTEKDLAALAKDLRQKAGKTRAQAGRDIGVSHVSIHRAEENPEESLLKLRIQMIEAYSEFKVVGPIFVLSQNKNPAETGFQRDMVFKPSRVSSKK